MSTRNRGNCEWSFDALDDTGASNPYGLGTIYTRAQINAALSGGPALATRDAVGHGVASAGIAAGNGRGNALYRGMAPNATLIIVKAVTEGAAARTTWRDIDGIQRSITGTGNIGELWLGSSIGPTFDGRRGVDLAAPEDLVIAPSGQNSIRSTFRFNNVENGNFLYGVQNAVSGAAPQVTGVIALMLEADPTLTPAEVRTALQQSARQDGFTGAVPNTMWGFGKMDAFGAVTIVKNNLPPRKVRSRRY